MYTPTRVATCVYNRAGELKGPRKVRVDYRLDPELAAWVETEAVRSGSSKTTLVEEALRRLRSGQTGVSPAVQVPPAGPDRADRFRTATGRRP